MVTDTPRECAGLARVFVVLGLDKVFIVLREEWVRLQKTRTRGRSTPAAGVESGRRPEARHRAGALRKRGKPRHGGLRPRVPHEHGRAAVGRAQARGRECPGCAPTTTFEPSESTETSGTLG